MRKTQIYLGIILALVLLYSTPGFAGDESLGAQGMLSTSEMRTAIKSGGSFTSQGNVLNGGTQVRYGGDEQARSAPITNANTINSLNTKGYAAGPGGTTILSGAAVSRIVSNAMSQTQTIYNGGKTIVDYASYGLNRGVSAAMGNAVNALQNSQQAVAQSLNLAVTKQPVLAVQSGINSNWAPPGGQDHQVLSEDKAKKMDDYAAKLGLNMSDQNSHVTAATAKTTVVAASNPLVGTGAGDFLGLEPGTPAAAVAKTPTAVKAVPYSAYKSPANNVLKNGVNLSEPLKF